MSTRRPILALLPTLLFAFGCTTEDLPLPDPDPDPDPCVPQCPSINSCGLDPICGVSCGTCTDGATCVDGMCQTACTPECGTRVCGVDPVCGEPCGMCEASAMCTDVGLCVDVLRIEGTAPPSSVVTAEVGGETFRETADDAGRYSLTIDDLTLGGVVLLRAAGPAHVELASILDDIPALRGLAGDGVLEAAEHAGVRVNAVTTVWAASLIREGGADLLDDADNLEVAALEFTRSINADSALLGAMALQMAVTDSDLLPAGFVTTMQVAADPYALRDLALAQGGHPTLLTLPQWHPLFGAVLTHVSSDVAVGKLDVEAGDVRLSHTVLQRRDHIGRISTLR